MHKRTIKYLVSLGSVCLFGLSPTWKLGYCPFRGVCLFGDTSITHLEVCISLGISPIWKCVPFWGYQPLGSVCCPSRSACLFGDIAHLEVCASLEILPNFKCVPLWRYCHLEVCASLEILPIWKCVPLWGHCPFGSVCHLRDINHLEECTSLRILPI